MSAYSVGSLWDHNFFTISGLHNVNKMSNDFFFFRLEWTQYIYGDVRHLDLLAYNKNSGLTSMA